MNITIVAEVLGEANNGTSIAAYNLIKFLKSKGHNVKVVCPDKDKIGVEDYYVLPTINLGKIINGIFKKNNVVVAKYDEEIIKEAIKDADIVHFMMPLFIARKASLLARSMGKIVTGGFHAQAENLSSHLLLQNCNLANHIIYKLYDKNLYQRMDAIHYPTKFIQDLFEKEIGRKTNGYVISNGVNSEFKKLEISKPEEIKDKFLILFIGRLSKEKNHITLLKAIKKSKYQKDIQLIFAGQGPLEKKLRNYSKKLANPTIIKFFNRQELIEVINYCDLYVHPSTIEIEAISCLEAIKCGLVPIISNSPRCATKMFAKTEKSLFNYKSSKELASKIDYLIENKEELNSLKEVYSELAKNIDQDSCMQKMEDMFLEVYSKKGQN